MNTKNAINIFLVEDNHVFLLALKADIENSFKKLPIRIHAFETGEACMKKIGEENPSVVILDYNLNSTNPAAADGVKVLDWIKKTDPETNVIMLTSEDNIDIAVRSFQHGASDYVVKTDTKFKKINYSLTNIFKVMAAKRDVKKYRNIIYGIVTCITLLVLTVIAVQIFAPSSIR